MPNNLTVNIDLSRIKTLKIFSWLRSKNISETEMLRTFNCGVGFCLIVKKKNINKIKKYFRGYYTPYQIGHISKTTKELILQITYNGKNACIFISGNGTNLRSIILKSREYNFPANVKLVVSNREKALGLNYAKKWSIPIFILKKIQFQK